VGSGSLLFTGGGLALAPQFGAGVTSLVAGKAGLRGFVHALHAELAGQGIRVGTVTVAGTVSPGTPFDPDRIAERFWALHTQADGPVEIIHDGKP
jgi:NAD(P)-dependent dehydrogenase (short-subunit alcohol dehydrogenase family)